MCATAFENVSTETEVKDSIYNTLDAVKSDQAAQNCVAKIYRSRDLGNAAIPTNEMTLETAVDAYITYDTLKYLRSGVTINNVTDIITNVKNFVNRLDGLQELRSGAISNAIEAGLDGFPAGDIADIINRII